MIQYALKFKTEHVAIIPKGDLQLNYSMYVGGLALFCLLLGFLLFICLWFCLFKKFLQDYLNRFFYLESDLNSSQSSYPVYSRL